MEKDHQVFKKIIQYCKLMNYDVNDILEMSDNELRLWYNRVLKMTKNEVDFRIETGMSIDSQGKEHKLLSIVQTKFHSKESRYNGK